MTPALIGTGYYLFGPVVCFCFPINDVLASLHFHAPVLIFSQTCPTNSRLRSHIYVYRHHREFACLCVCVCLRPDICAADATRLKPMMMENRSWHSTHTPPSTQPPRNITNTHSQIHEWQIISLQSYGCSTNTHFRVCSLAVCSPRIPRTLSNVRISVIHK